MSVVVVVTAFPLPGHRAEVIAAFEEAIARVHYEAGLELYALHEGPDRLVMIEKYESEQARSEHLQGASLADLRSALEGKLSSGLDAQVLVPHPAETRRRARCDHGGKLARLHMQAAGMSAVCGLAPARDRTACIRTRRAPAR